MCMTAVKAYCRFFRCDITSFSFHTFPRFMVLGRLVLEWQPVRPQHKADDYVSSNSKRRGLWKALRKALPLRQCCVGLHESQPTSCLIMRSLLLSLLLFHTTVTHRQIYCARRQKHTNTHCIYLLTIHYRVHIFFLFSCCGKMLYKSTCAHTQTAYLHVHILYLWVCNYLVVGVYVPMFPVYVSFVSVWTFCAWNKSIHILKAYGTINNLY